jgi:DNA processing protein
VTDLTEEDCCLVALAATEGVGTASIARLLGHARRRRLPLRHVMSLPAQALEHQVDLSGHVARLVARLSSPVTQGRDLCELMFRRGGAVLTTSHPSYPSALSRTLGAAAPPVIFTRGNIGLLSRAGVAVVGSRRPSSLARAAAGRFAGVRAREGDVVFSGGARGIDAVAHRSAVDSGATAVLPAMGVWRFGEREVGLDAAAHGRWCAANSFPPDSPWRAGHALVRNRLIVALSTVVVAFEPRDEGGTWHTCMEALRARKPLFVVTASRHGAKRRGQNSLVRMGAVALDPRRMPDAPAFARLVAEYVQPPRLRGGLFA